jgi:drug/metabolite transporter (DMT)-like permease
LNGALPLLTAVVASVRERQLPSRPVTIGLSVGLIGAVLIALPTLREGHSSVVGVLLILVALLSYSFALGIAGPLQYEHGALPVIWRAQLVALLLTMPLGVPDVVRAHWTRGAVLSLIALGALGTAIAYVLQAISVGRVGPTRASATTFFIPGVALLLGVAVRHEQVALLSVIGGAVCVAGAWLMRGRASSSAG